MNESPHISTPSTDQITRTEQVVALFLSSHSGATNCAYRKDLIAFAGFLCLTSPEEAGSWLLSATSSEVNLVAATWQRQMMSSDLSPATVNRRIAAVRSLLALGRALGTTASEIRLGDLRACPTRDTRGPGANAVAQMVALLEQGETPKSLRDLCILRLLYDLGLRRAEVVSINVEDIDLARNELWVKGKCRPAKERFGLPGPTLKALAGWLAARGSAPGPLFTNFDRANKGGRLCPNSVYRIVRGLGERVGVRTRPHGVRHSAITEAIKLAAREGLDLSVVQAFSRHADPRTLFLYRDAEGDSQASVSSAIANGLSI
jgi:integrase/recombinase XerC